MSQEKIQELQILEQNLQNILIQKQTFQLELSETQTALDEVKKSEQDVYKIIGNLMLKSEKSQILEDLENKKKLLETRLNSFEKQEEKFSEKIQELRKEFENSQKNSQSKK